MSRCMPVGNALVPNRHDEIVGPSQVEELVEKRQEKEKGILAVRIEKRERTNEMG